MRLDTEFVKLPLRFDAARLAAEVAAIPESSWRPHPQGYAGNSALALIAVGGDPATTPPRGRCCRPPDLAALPYMRQVLAAFQAPIGRTRLMPAGRQRRGHGPRGRQLLLGRADAAARAGGDHAGGGVRLRRPVGPHGGGGGVGVRHLAHPQRAQSQSDAAHPPGRGHGGLPRAVGPDRGRRMALRGVAAPRGARPPGPVAAGGGGGAGDRAGESAGGDVPLGAGAAPGGRAARSRNGGAAGGAPPDAGDLPAPLARPVGRPRRAGDGMGGLSGGGRGLRSQAGRVSQGVPAAQRHGRGGYRAPPDRAASAESGFEAGKAGTSGTSGTTETGASPCCL